MINSSNTYKYDPNQDYCNDARKFQSVLDENETRDKLIDNNKSYSPNDIKADREGTLYSCPDNYKMGSIRDNQIYISATDKQHDIYASGEKFRDHKDEVNCPTGYFSDQTTVDACKNGNVLDNANYNEMCQIAPYRDGGIGGAGDATYKPHVDCFEIDRDALYKNYGTCDFNAAVSKCEANNQFGSGGGNQGYNPHIAEMIDNGTLKYNPDKSYSSKEDFCKSEHKNPNELTNSSVKENDYKDMMRDAKTRSSDCVKNNTPHPSEEARKNGFEKTQNPVEGETGNARIKNQVKGNADNSVETADAKKEPTTKASDEASKVASDHAAQNVAPKPNGMGM